MQERSTWCGLTPDSHKCIYLHSKNASYLATAHISEWLWKILSSRTKKVDSQWLYVGCLREVKLVWWNLNLAAMPSNEVLSGERKSPMELNGFAKQGCKNKDSVWSSKVKGVSLRRLSSCDTGREHTFQSYRWSNADRQIFVDRLQEMAICAKSGVLPFMAFK